jgi:hypothetical protein
MEDNGSKFGTLVAVKSPIPLTEQVRIQAGRTVIEFDPSFHPEPHPLPSISASIPEEEHSDEPAVPAENSEEDSVSASVAVHVDDETPDMDLAE